MAKLSESNPIPIGQTEEMLSEPITSKESISISSHYTASHGQTLKGDFTHMSMEKSTPAVPSERKTCSRVLNQSKTHTLLSSEASNEEQVHDPMAIAPVDTSSRHAYEIMIRCHKKLVTALSTDILSISGKIPRKKIYFRISV